MKKAYVTPIVEKVEFQYDKVVVASGGPGTALHTFYDGSGKCKNYQGYTGDGYCDSNS